MTTISLRIPDDLHNLLERVAKEEERSKSSLVKKAIKTYLEDLYDYNLVEKGYKDYLSSGKKGYSLEEIKKDILENEASLNV